MLTEQDKINQSVWSTAAAMRDLDCNALFTDEGEHAALDFVNAEARGKPILDLGVGRGRTIPLLRPLTNDYRAIDYMQSMVDISRRRYPGTDVALGDARDLSDLPESHFGLVQFSNNGIDAVNAADRLLVFAAVRRVLLPGGLFLFSSLNLDGPAFRARPWHWRLPRALQPLRLGVRVAREMAWMPVHVAKWLKVLRHTTHGDGYAVAPLPAHHWGLVAHYTTLQHQFEELEQHGFAPDPVVFDNLTGERVLPGHDTSRFDHFHVVARRL
ncbi:MAG TPA: class I SAM-dependent methyltransferase [Polyangiaceae bacterium]|nr:class I SAM-dependent methyltransferase [Polyangiaceae bacterium]